MIKLQVIDIADCKTIKTAKSSKIIPFNLNNDLVEELEDEIGSRLINLNYHYFDNYLEINKFIVNFLIYLVFSSDRTINFR